MSEQKKSLEAFAFEVWSNAKSLGLSNLEGSTRVAEAVAARVREECARLAEDFQWQLPISGEIGLDSTTIQMQIAAAIRALNSGEQSCP